MKRKKYNTLNCSWKSPAITITWKTRPLTSWHHWGGERISQHLRALYGRRQKIRASSSMEILVKKVKNNAFQVVGNFKLPLLNSVCLISTLARVVLLYLKSFHTKRTCRVSFPTNFETPSFQEQGTSIDSTSHLMLQLPASLTVVCSCHFAVAQRELKGYAENMLQPKTGRRYDSSCHWGKTPSQQILLVLFTKE